MAGTRELANSCTSQVNLKAFTNRETFQCISRLNSLIIANSLIKQNTAMDFETKFGRRKTFQGQEASFFFTFRGGRRFLPSK